MPPRLALFPELHHFIATKDSLGSPFAQIPLMLRLGSSPEAHELWCHAAAL